MRDGSAGNSDGSSCRSSRPRRLRLAMLGCALASALLASGCSSRFSQFKGSLGDMSGGTQPGSAARSAPADLQDLARRYDARPGEKGVSIAYAAALKAGRQHAQAVAVLQRASIQNVGDREIAAAYGKSLADVGKFQEAMQVLSQAHSADRPDWRILSSQGAISDQMGEHARAREFYQQALQIAPDEPAILTNYGLSFVLTRDLATAETYLRKAASQPGADERVKANLDLVLSLRAREPQAGPAKATKVTPAKVRVATAPVKAPMPLAGTPAPR